MDRTMLHCVRKTHFKGLNVRKIAIFAYRNESGTFLHAKS
jgi:hypothetical protein